MEIAFLNWLQTNLVCPPLTAVMEPITTLGNGGMIWIVVIGLLLIRKETRWAGIVALAALALNVLLCNVLLKPLIARPRPFDAAAFQLLIDRPLDFSFPSGHTSSSFAVATAVCLWDRRWGVAALILAALIAFSRLYFAVHFPTDVLAGAIIGMACAFAAQAIVRRLQPKLKSRRKNKSMDK